ncbi:protease inhibitor [Streptomyces finlayi]|uniref:Protease inhibitor n=1 Tax=Streptomyces finlayi TaxID=67296 RepID=A0A7G7BK98_9ACTN|nr:SSI family serine proteinase inhibitor [Streptomyces finlayi]QNE75763.1 protease inhibitor [Streptomyces finlayi]
MNKTTAAVAAVLLGIGLAGTSHAAAPFPASTSAPSSGTQFAVEEFDMTLSVTGSGRTWARAVVLTCPAADTDRHSDSAAACAELVEAGGELDALPGDSHGCTREFDPVTAWADGTYRGRPVHWSKTYPNACALDSATGTVFRF